MKKVLLGIGITFASIFIIGIVYLSGYREGAGSQISNTEAWSTKYNTLNTSYTKLNNLCNNYYSFQQDMNTIGIDYKQETTYYQAIVNDIVNGDTTDAYAQAGAITQLSNEINGIIGKYNTGKSNIN